MIYPHAVKVCSSVAGTVCTGLICILKSLQDLTGIGSAKNSNRQVCVMKWQYQSIVEVFSGSMGGTDEDNISILKSFVLDSSLH